MIVRVFEDIGLAEWQGGSRGRHGKGKDIDGRVSCRGDLGAGW